MAVLEFLISSLIVAVVVVIAQTLWRKRGLYFHSLQFEGPLSYPLIGNGIGMLAAGGDFLLYSSGLFEKYPDILKVWLGGKLIVIDRRPNDIALICKNFFEKDTDFYDQITPITGDSLLTAHVQRWKRHRRIAAPTMNKKAVNEFVEIFGSFSDSLVKNLEQECGKGDFVVDYHLLSNNFRTSCATFLDIYFDSNKGPLTYVTEGSRALKSTSPRMVLANLGLIPLWKTTSEGREFSRIVEMLREFVAKLVLNKQKIETESTFCDPMRVTLMDQLLGAMKKDDTWSTDELTDILQTIIGIGTDTSATSLSYTFTAFGIYQNIQETAYQEQQRIFGDSSRNPTIEDLQKMVYLERVLNESMRMFPPAPMMAKLITRDMELDDGYILPSGCTFAVNLMAVHRNPKYWNEPLKFDPDRFLPEECLKRPSGSFIPFSLGSRNCVGLHYGMANMKVFASKVIRNFKITTPVKSLLDLDVHFEVVCKPQGGCKIALEKR